MHGLARDLGMGPAKGLEGRGASPRLGSQAIALAKLLSNVSRPIATLRAGLRRSRDVFHRTATRTASGVVRSPPPEDEVPSVLAGVQDEHGVVRFRVGVNVDDRPRAWQGAGRFQKQLGGTGHISSGAGG